jgi:hypothetical protein
MPRRSDRQTAWAQGGLKLVGCRVLEHYNTHVRPFLPRCSATRKNGDPCRNLALSGSSKCRVHGGATPRGDDWHTRQWPNGKAPDWQQKLNAKLKRSERDKRRQDRRRAKMSPEERERHERWQWDHKPGPADERARRRADRKAAAEIRESLERVQDRPVSPELAALEAERRRIETERDSVLRQIENNKPVGVFG